MQSLYFIALLPPEMIREEVRALKLEMQQRFGAGHALKSPAHITLQMPFRLPDEKVRALADALRKFAASRMPFRLRLGDFDCFAPRVIYVSVKDSKPLARLESELKTVLGEKGILPSTGEDLPFHPHMTIATRDLDEAAFQRAWPEFAKRSFHMDFKAKSLFLLRHNGSVWEVYREFGFGVRDSKGLPGC